MLGRASKGGRVSGAAAMSVKRLAGRSDLYSEIVPRHNAYLSLFHGSAKRRMLLQKQTVKQFFDQRLSHAVVNIADEETEIDFLAGSGTWPRISAHCVSSSKPCALRSRHALRRLRVSHPSGSKRSQMVGLFVLVAQEAQTMTTEVVVRSGTVSRQEPPTSCKVLVVQEAQVLQKVTVVREEPSNNHKVPVVREARRCSPTRRQKSTFRRKRTRGASLAWTKPGARMVTVRRLMTACLMLSPAWLTRCSKRTLRIARGWEPSSSCREPRHRSAAVRVADEIITFLREAKIENRQIDRAMAGTGFKQNLKKEDDVIVTRGPGARSVHLGLSKVAKAADFAGVPKTVIKYLGSRLAWNLSFAHERGARIAAALEA